jgi:hypothetical protein
MWAAFPSRFPIGGRAKGQTLALLAMGFSRWYDGGRKTFSAHEKNSTSELYSG